MTRTIVKRTKQPRDITPPPLFNCGSLQLSKSSQSNFHCAIERQAVARLNLKFAIHRVRRNDGNVHHSRCQKQRVPDDTKPLSEAATLCDREAGIGDGTDLS